MASISLANQEGILSIVDKGIRPAVKILMEHGFKTFESCEGGEGHCFPEPTVSFEGEEFDLIRAYEVCKLYGLCVFNARRVYSYTSIYRDGTQYVGEAWDKPYNQLTFIKHSNI